MTPPPSSPGASRIDQPWEPRTVAVLTDHDVRVVRTSGEFTVEPGATVDTGDTPSELTAERRLG